MAAVMMMVKEHGLKTAAVIVVFVFPFAFLVGGLVRLVAGS
jgi:Fe2+ transport system protein B